MEGGEGGKFRVGECLGVEMKGKGKGVALALTSAQMSLI